MKHSFKKQEIMKYIRVAKFEPHLYSAMETISIEGSRYNRNVSRLPVNLQHSVRATFAPKYLEHLITEAMSEGTIEVTDGIRKINISAVDSVIRADYNNKGHGRYVVYFVNLPKTTESHCYSPGPNIQKCTNVWLGEGYGNRYVWLDLTATRINDDRGTLVRKSYRKALEELETSAAALTKDENKKAYFLANLVAILDKIARIALTPSPAVLPASSGDDIKVEVLILHSEDGSDNPEQLSRKYRKLADFFQHFQVPGITSNNIHTTVTAISNRDCSICKFALEKSLYYTDSAHQIYLNPFSVETTRKFRPRMNVHIDSSEFRQYFDEMLSARRQRFESEPLYVLVVTESLLKTFQPNDVFVDRNRKVAFVEKTIIAIEPGGADEAVCGNIAKGLLQIVFGMSDVNFCMNPSTHIMEDEPLLKAAINNKFLTCTYSCIDKGSTCWNFAELDSIRRAFVISELLRTSSQISTRIELYKNYDQVSFHDVLGAEFTEFIQRWNIYKFKYERSLTFISQLNFEGAYALAKSARHDSNAIEAIISRTTKLHSPPTQTTASSEKYQKLAYGTHTGSTSVKSEVWMASRLIYVALFLWMFWIASSNSFVRAIIGDLLVDEPERQREKREGWGRGGGSSSSSNEWRADAGGASFHFGGSAQQQEGVAWRRGRRGRDR
mmetsp:Transcript_12256/g.22294  ORF Transcript_12256/g.22294 Transcript_12256/m.22294 type:complete len:668 (-) Transcript_12256:136-2139(-)